MYGDFNKSMIGIWPSASANRVRQKSGLREGPFAFRLFNHTLGTQSVVEVVLCLPYRAPAYRAVCSTVPTYLGIVVRHCSLSLVRDKNVANAGAMR